jgi:glycosyltransferase involved in cell wall biosynthesis
VYIEGRIAGSSLHSLYAELLLFPPEGYTFITDSQKQTVDLKTNSLHSFDQDLMRHLYLKRLSDFVRPWAYFSYYQLKSKSVPADLMYSCGHLVFTKTPWIVDMEHAGALIGYGFNFAHSKRFIEQLLSSPYCKKILPWTDTGKNTILFNLNCTKFIDKIEVVRLAVRPKTFVKKFANDKIKILFVGTMSNINGSFFHKGGLIALESFKILNTFYKNLELVIRSAVPPEIRAECQKYPNIKLIEKRVPWCVVEHEFETSDIFLHPGFFTPGMAIIDAMSYELPVVTTDVWANPETITDGVTGLLVPQAKNVPYYANYYLPKEATWDVMAAIIRPDPVLVNDVVKKTALLIEDEKLRRRMGRMARKEIEFGRFSIEKRNMHLKKIFDNSI